MLMLNSLVFLNYNYMPESDPYDQEEKNLRKGAKFLKRTKETVAMLDDWIFESIARTPAVKACKPWSSNSQRWHRYNQIDWVKPKPLATWDCGESHRCTWRSYSCRQTRKWQAFEGSQRGDSGCDRTDTAESWYDWVHSKTEMWCSCGCKSASTKPTEWWTARWDFMNTWIISLLLLFVVLIGYFRLNSLCVPYTICSHQWDIVQFKK